MCIILPLLITIRINILTTYKSKAARCIVGALLIPTCNLPFNGEKIIYCTSNLQRCTQVISNIILVSNIQSVMKRFKILVIALFHIVELTWMSYLKQYCFFMHIISLDFSALQDNGYICQIRKKYFRSRMKRRQGNNIRSKEIMACDVQISVPINFIK